MRKNLLITLVLCLSFLFAAPQEGFANIKELKKKIYKQRVQDMKLGRGQMGRKFIVAIPPNETESFGWGDSAMEVYIASAMDVDLDLTILGSKKKMKLKGDDVLILNNENGLSKMAAEIREPNTPTDKTITIEASGPVSVYVMNSKSATSDGYMALPVDSWQEEYMHCAYWDNDEGSSSTEFAAGFLVLASEDNTRVSVTLRGEGAFASKLKNSFYNIGDNFEFTLDEGQVYQVETEGTTRGLYDISGTSVIGDKPIGIISYHWRASIPIFDNDSRDHLSAMPMPVKTWGQEYASIALERGGSKKGDIFRIMAAEPNTEYEVKWYDFETKEIIGRKPGLLKHKGSWDEYTTEKTTTDMSTSITGTSIFRANKPVFIMQYSCSSSWDGAGYDPFMWPVTPVEQYIPSTIVQAPDNKSFAENHINIIALHDTTDVEKDGLKSLTFDDTRVVDIVPSFTTNRIPETNLYWARFPIGTGKHDLKGENVTFGGYIYGFKNVDSYGWPAAMALKNLSETDTVPPAVTVEGDCGEWIISVTELEIDPNEEADPRQVDTEVWTEPAIIIKDSTIDGTPYKSENIKDVQYLDKNGQPDDWEYGPHNDYQFMLQVENMKEHAICYFAVVDDAGNITIDSVEYHAASLEITNPEEEPIDFFRQQIMEDHFLDVTFENTGSGPILIEDIKVKIGKFYSVVPDEGDYDITELAAGDEMTLRLQYSPTKEIEDAEYFDIDTLSIETECLPFEFEIVGQGVTPKIDVTDWKSDSPQYPGDKVEKTVDYGFKDGIWISNEGSDTLIVTQAMFETGIPEFEFIPYLNDNAKTPVTFPIEVQPKMFSEGNEWKVQIMGEYFTPTEVDRYQDNLIFSSNAFDPVAESDSISEWDLVSSKGTVTLTGYDFEMQHVGTKKDTDKDGNPITVTVENTGNETVVVTELAFFDDVPANDNFKFVDGSGNLVANYNIDPSDEHKGIELAEGETHTFNVVFVPTEEKEDINTRIYAKYYTITDIDKEFQKDASSFLEGQGTQPNVAITSAEFASAAPGTPIENAEVQTLEIINDDEFEDLVVTAITIDDDQFGYAADFTLVEANGVEVVNGQLDPNNPVIVPFGQSVEIKYAYHPADITPNRGNIASEGFLKITNIILETNATPGSGAPNYEELTEDYIALTSLSDVNYELQAEDTGYLKGFVIEGDASNTGYPFGLDMRCEIRTGDIQLNNLSITQNMVIKDVVITGDDEGVFEVLNKQDLIDKVVPMSTDTETNFEECTIEFDPTAVDISEYIAADGVLNFTAQVHMVYSFEGSPTEKETQAQDITASARILNVDIAQKIATKVGAEERNIPIQPGMFSYNVGGNTPHYTNYFVISIDNKDDWDDLEITSLSISYRYKKAWMGLVDADRQFSLNTVPGFEVTKDPNPVDEGEYIVDTYTISTQNPNGFISYETASAAMLNPHFLLYLSGDTKYTPEITNVTFGTRDECVTYTASTEEIPLVNCIQDINLISSTGQENLAPSLAPNPVVTEKATVTYGVALNAQASLKIYDTEGKVVKVIVDSYQNAGTYTVDVDTKDLPNGVYIMRLEQGTFTGEGSMVISK